MQRKKRREREGGKCKENHSIKRKKKDFKVRIKKYKKKKKKRLV